MPQPEWALGEAAASHTMRKTPTPPLLPGGQRCVRPPFPPRQGREGSCGSASTSPDGPRRGGFGDFVGGSLEPPRRWLGA